MYSPFPPQSAEILPPTPDHELDKAIEHFQPSVIENDPALVPEAVTTEELQREEQLLKQLHKQNGKLYESNDLRKDEQSSGESSEEVLQQLCESRRIRDTEGQHREPDNDKGDASVMVGKRERSEIEEGYEADTSSDDERLHKEEETPHTSPLPTRTLAQSHRVVLDSGTGKQMRSVEPDVAASRTRRMSTGSLGLVHTEDDPTEKKREQFIGSIARALQGKKANSINTESDHVNISATGIAREYEYSLFHHCGGVNQHYRDKIRELLFNLKENAQLRTQILNGKIRPEQLSEMSYKDLAKDSLIRDRAEAYKSDLRDHLAAADIPIGLLDNKDLVKK